MMVVHFHRSEIECEQQLSWQVFCCTQNRRNCLFSRDFLWQILFFSLRSLQLLELHLSLTWEMWISLGKNFEFVSPKIVVRIVKVALRCLKWGA